MLDAFNDMALRVYEGQRLDMDFETADDVTLDDYLRMVGDKTGALLGAATGFAPPTRAPRRWPNTA